LIVPRLVFGSYRADKQSDTLTNKQTPLKPSTALRYATSEGKYCSLKEQLQLCHVRTTVGTSGIE